jgi:hypothetical protein
MFKIQKAILESEREWSNNRKLIELSASRNGIRGAIPRGFPYFAVDFGLQSGFAHLVERSETFPANFAQVVHSEFP